MTYVCPAPHCEDSLPAVTRYLPLEDGTWLKARALDQTAYREHLLAEHGQIGVTLWARALVGPADRSQRPPLYSEQPGPWR